MSKPQTFCEAFQRTAARDPKAIALRAVGGSPSLTWADYAQQVRDVAAGLSGLGVQRGDTVALMMTNRIEFYPLEVGAQHLGATSFSIYNTLPPAQIAYILTNSRTKVVLCEEQFLGQILDAGVAVEHIVCVDAAPSGTLSLDGLKAAAKPEFAFEEHWRAVTPSDVLTLIYTSGTTGNPKGAEMTHASLIYETHAMSEILPVEFGDRITSYFPSAHIADRLTALYLHEVFGTQITVVSSPNLIGPALTDCRPTIWGAVPRVWDKLMAGVKATVAAAPDEVRPRLEWALDVAARKAEEVADGGPQSPQLTEEYARADREVLSMLRERLGLEQVRWAISGAAPLSATTLKFFTGLGVPVTEVWGMSELCCVATVVHPSVHKIGTIGRLMDGIEGKLADDGELLIRGPLLMAGYRDEPEKTAEAVDVDGWLHTGDVMTMDDEGCLTIIDRKKELIINAAGKNMSPSNIENWIKPQSSLIGGVAAIGDGRSYNTALVALDTDASAAYCAERGLDPDPAVLSRDPEVVDLIRLAITSGNSNLARVEQVKRFLILPTFWEPGGDELTITMKLRRRPISEKYAQQIEQLYADPRPADVHEPLDAAAAVSI